MISDTLWFRVRYKVKGFGAQSVGPYRGHEEAVMQAEDIRGYAGVSDVVVEVVGPPDDTQSTKDSVVCSNCGYGICPKCAPTAYPDAKPTKVSE